MTSTRSSSPNAKTRSVARRIESFRQRFSDGHFYLACHAALPVALTPDLLYSLWANFQRDTRGEAIEIPWIAVADLMLSNLCKEVGHELFEMDRSVRDELLHQLQQDSRFGLERVRDLADFVMAYVERDLDHPDLDARAIAETQRWRAIAYLQPTETAREIAIYLSQLNFKDKSEWIRMAALLETLSKPLSEFQSLLTYAQAMASFARGKLEEAMARIRQAVDANNQVTVAGVSLPIPQAIQSASSENSARLKTRTTNPILLLRRLAFTGLGIILAGQLQHMQNLTQQSSPEVASSPNPTAQSSSPTPSPSSPTRTTTPTPSPTPLTKTTPRAQPSTAQKRNLSAQSPIQALPSPSGNPVTPSGPISPQGTRSPSQPTPQGNTAPSGSSNTPQPSQATSQTPQTPSQGQASSSGNSNTDMVQITADQIMQIAPEAPPDRVRQLVPYLNQAMAEFGINTRLRQAHFLAQIAHESDRFNALEEYTSGADYEGRTDLGNTQPGDGVRFKGRGLFNIAGKINYEIIGKALGVDLVNNPKRLADPDLAARSAAWWWSTVGLNSVADKDDIKAVTQRVNGGFNGLDDRTQLLERAKKVLGI